jgi:hypothetical protein
VKGVLFDARWVRTGMTGVGHYAYNILRSRSIPREKCAVILQADCPYADAFSGYRIFRTRVDLTAHPATDLFEQFMILYLCYRHDLSFPSKAGFPPSIRESGPFPSYTTSLICL